MLHLATKRRKHGAFRFQNIYNIGGDKMILFICLYYASAIVFMVVGGLYASMYYKNKIGDGGVWRALYVVLERYYKKRCRLSKCRKLFIDIIYVIILPIVSICIIVEVIKECDRLISTH